jgi:hypothetical protein
VSDQPGQTLIKHGDATADEGAATGMLVKAEADNRWPDNDLGTSRAAFPQNTARQEISPPGPMRPRRWALVQVWNGAVLATYDDEASARDAIGGVDDDEVVVLHVDM